jgi:hypothetical protein
MAAIPAAVTTATANVGETPEMMMASVANATRMKMAGTRARRE